MFDPESVIFPIPAKKFIEIQERNAGRKGNADKLDLWEAMANIANTAYACIRGGCPDAVEAILADLENDLGGCDELKHVVTACYIWVQLAAKQAIRELETPGGGLKS